MRVLVVGDEKRLAAGLRNGLEAEGLAVDAALNCTDSLWMARENTYDAIVLDIMLPGVNGYVIWRAVPSNRCTALTGRSAGPYVVAVRVSRQAAVSMSRSWVSTLPLTSWLYGLGGRAGSVDDRCRWAAS
jgi:CheY-like chemotaxis protein